MSNAYLQIFLYDKESIWIMNKQTYDKINKDRFLENVKAKLAEQCASEDGTVRDLYTVEEVFKACIDELIDLICAGHRVAFTGFGSFYAQLHKGHPVQFGGKKGAVRDYRVVKFASSNVLNKKVRDSDPE